MPDLLPNKICPQCCVPKSLTAENFYKSSQTKSGFKPWCKSCVNRLNLAYDNTHKKKRCARVMRSRNKLPSRKASHVEHTKKWQAKNYDQVCDTRIAKKFGVPKGWWKAKIASLNGCCEICGTPHKSSEHPKVLSVDHCHATNQVRGLICSNCNLGLGHFQDRPDFMQAAIAYLKKYANGLS